MKNEDFEFKLILPKRDNSGNKINAETHKRYASELARRFGGVTIIDDVLGCCINQRGILQCEKNIIMVANRDNKVWDSDKKKLILTSFEDDKQFIGRLSKQAGFELGQFSIFSEGDRNRNVVFKPGLGKDALPAYLLDKNAQEGESEINENIPIF